MAETMNREFHYQIKYFHPNGHLVAAYVTKKPAPDITSGYYTLQKQHRPKGLFVKISCITSDDYDKFIATENRNFAYPKGEQIARINLTLNEAHKLLQQGYISFVYATADCEGFLKGDIVSMYKTPDAATRRATCNKSWAAMPMKTHIASGGMDHAKETQDALLRDSQPN